MNNKVKFTEEELEFLKERSLFFYQEDNVYGMTSEAFWGKCVLKSVQELLYKKGVVIEVELPSTHPFQIIS